MATPTNNPGAPITPHTHRHRVDGSFACSKDQQRRYACDIEWAIVGPMPVDEFLNEFFPDPPDREVGFGHLGINYDEIRFASIPDTPVKEEDICEGLVSVKLSICNTSNWTNFSVAISTK